MSNSSVEVTSQPRSASYVPAAGHHATLSIYDPLVKAIGADRAKGALIEQGGLSPAQRVLDIGCGTGTLAILLSKRYPGIDVHGLDPDPKALARAERKAERARVPAQFALGFSNQLPYSSESFDRVFSSFMFHHVDPAQREDTLREARRVLRAGGSFHLLDFARPQHGYGLFGHIMRSSPLLKDNTEARMLELFERAGFKSAQKVAGKTILLGMVPIAYYSARV